MVGRRNVAYNDSNTYESVPQHHALVIFHTTLGHDVFALSCVGFMTTFQRGTEWVATGRVTQKVPATFPTAKTVSYRVDIAEMDPGFLNGASPVVP